MNTYKKTGKRGQLWLTRFSLTCCLPVQQIALCRSLFIKPIQGSFPSIGAVRWSGSEAGQLYSIVRRKSLPEAVKSILLMLTALFPIVNPLGGSPVFLALTRQYPASERRKLAWRVAVNSFVLLIASTFVGTNILDFFGISIPVVQVGGGLIVISNGWALLKRNEDGERERDARKSVKRTDAFKNAFYPLTLPLAVGPGSISVAITLGANIPHRLGAHILAILSAVIASLLIAVSIFLCYGFADRLAAIVGESGMSIILRLSSFLLVCIGVQIFWNGANTLLRSLPLLGQ